jgi:hypothetical protein
LTEISGETVDKIAAQIVRLLDTYELGAKVVRLSARNTSTNCRGLQQRSKENVINRIASTKQI